MISQGESWMRQRNALSKRILRPAEIAKFVGKMNEVSQEFAAKIKQIRKGPGEVNDADVVEALPTELNKWAMECEYEVK